MEQANGAQGRQAQQPAGAPNGAGAGRQPAAVPAAPLLGPGQPRQQVVAPNGARQPAAGPGQPRQPAVAPNGAGAGRQPAAVPAAPLFGPAQPRFDIGPALLGPPPTKGNIGCHILAKID